MADKWDGLLAEGTPETPELEHPTHSGRAKAQYNWGRILLAIATVALTVGLTIWWPIRSATNEHKASQAATETAHTATEDPTWSYDTEVSVEANDGAKSTIYQVATALLTNRHDAAGGLLDWWTIDERLAAITDDMLRYELVEYPEMQTAGLEPAETITTIHFNEAADADVGRWAGTITVALTGPHGEREITVNVTAKAIEDGWHVIRWEVES